MVAPGADAKRKIKQFLKTYDPTGRLWDAVTIEIWDTKRNPNRLEFTLSKR